MKLSLYIFFGALSFAIVVFGISSAARAQEPSPTPEFQPACSESIPYKPRLFTLKSKPKEKDKKKPDSVQKQTEEKLATGPVVIENAPITLLVSVFDTDGKFVRDLRKEDFKVLVDGPEVEILSVEQKRQPLNAIFLIDVSPSANDYLKSTKNLALSIAQQFGAGDKLMVIEFSSSLQVVSELTNDQAKIRRAIERIREAGGGTSLYDAVSTVFEKHIPSLTGRKVVILFTDGVDTTSKTLYSASLAIAEKTDATVFPIYLDTYEATNRIRPFGGIGSSIPADIQRSLQQALGNNIISLSRNFAAEYEVGKLYLNDLVFLSGGRAMPASDINDRTKKISTSIAEELGLQYYVTFRPNGAAQIGQRKHLKVRVNRPNLAVLARGSYIVGSPPSH